MKAAVQENADVIAGRVPGPLRARRRLMHRWGRRGLLLAPLCAMVAALAVADPPVAVQASPVPPAVAPAEVFSTAVLEPGLSPLPRPLDADALALGVRRVVLDPGHGGHDNGASSGGGAHEKDLALDLARRVGQLLAGAGLDVALTRSTDSSMSLKERTAAANAWRGDIFVSIHLNALEPAGVRGVETYYLGPGQGPEHDLIASVENQHSGFSLGDMRRLLDGIYADARRDESRRLARAVQRALVARLTPVNPGLVDRGVKTAPFVVLVATEMPAILAEVSCLSNEDEAARLETPAYRQSIAAALASGIQTFIAQKNTDLEEMENSSER